MTLDRLRIVAAAIESEKGTAETLANADADILAIDPRCPYTPAELERLVLSSDLDKFNSIPGPPIITMTFGVELRGSGTGATPPSWFRLLRACGTTQTINTADVDIDPVSDEDTMSTVTLATIIGNDTDALWVEMQGAMGNAVLTANVNQIPRIDFTMTGVVSQIQNASPLSPTYESTLPFRWYNAQIQIGGTEFSSGNYGAFTLDLGNEVEVLENANDTDGLEYAVVGNRNPGGSIDPRMVPLTTFNPYTKMTTPTTETLQVVFGSAAGNILTLTAPAFQVTGVGDAARQGHMVWPLTYRLRRSSGDDSFQITHS